MNNILAFNVPNLDDIASQIADRVKTRRLELNLTQEGLATRSGLSLQPTEDLSRRGRFH